MKLFISKKKLIKLIKDTQLEIRKENQAIKQSYCFKKDEKSKRSARDWQEDFALSLEELQAINKQVEELRWK